MKPQKHEKGTKSILKRKLRGAEPRDYCAILGRLDFTVRKKCQEERCTVETAVQIKDRGGHVLKQEALQKLGGMR